MGKNLIKSPLTALIFAAMWHFAATLAPTSQSYSEILGGFVTPRMGYVFMIVYGLWLSVITAIIYATARDKDKGIKLLLLSSISFVATQWVAPMLPQLRFGETTGVMSFSDSLFKIACGSAATIFLLIMATLLFKVPPIQNIDSQAAARQVPEKYKIRRLRLIIMIVVLPMVYCIIYFLSWYFLLWRSDAARAYYSGPTETPTFGQALIAVILTDAKQIPMSLVKGLVYELALLPVLFQLARRRVMFIASSIMLFLGVSLQMLIPSPVMPNDVRTAHLIEIAVQAVLYGTLASLMLHAGMRKPENQDAPGNATATGKAQAKPPAK